MAHHEFRYRDGIFQFRGKYDTLDHLHRVPAVTRFAYKMPFRTFHMPLFRRPAINAYEIFRLVQIV
jgi:hypothetical protein